MCVCVYIAEVFVEYLMAMEGIETNVSIPYFDIFIGPHSSLFSQIFHES